MSLPATAAASWAVRSSKAIHALLLGVGIVAAALAVAAYDRQLEPAQMTLMESRVTGVADALEVWESGGPPLAGRGAPFGAGAWETYRGYYPAGATDDVGIYLYLPAIGRLTGIDDPLRLLELFFLALMGLAFVALPLLLYHATGSLLIGVVGPLVAYQLLDFTVDTDIYWIAAWCYLLAVPALVAAARQRSTAACIGFLVAALLLASFANTIRSQVGLAVLIAAVVIGLQRVWSRPRAERLALLLVLLSSYVVFAPGLISTVEEYRDDRLGLDDFSERYSSGHPFWHPMYLGLGYRPNELGISWDDSVAADAVARVTEPDPVYLSPEYEAALRELYFDVVREHPGFVVQTYATKVAVLAVDVYESFPLIYAAVALCLAVGSRRREFRRALYVAAPAIVIGALPPLMTVPVEVYEVGLLGAVAVVGLLAIAALALAARDVFEYGRRSGLSLDRPTGERLAIGLGAALLLTVAPALLRPYAADARDGFSYQIAAAPIEASRPATTDVAVRWGAGELASWQREEGVTATAAPDALSVATTAGRTAYQLLSPASTLPPGDYLLELDATVRGGLAAGLFDSAADAWVRTPRGFTPELHGPAIFVPFTLTAPTPVRIILTNWRRTDTPSHWTLRSAAISRRAGSG